MSLPLQAWAQLHTITGAFLRPGGLAVTQEALNYCTFETGTPLLDAGCGLGGTIEYLHSQGYPCLGLDLSRDLLEQSLDSLYKNRKAVDICKTLPLLSQADIRHLPVKNASLGGIFCECVLSLLPEPHGVLQEFHRILRNDGKLIISDIIRKNTTEGTRACFSEGQSCLGGALPVELFTKILVDAGFTIIFEKDHTRLLAELAALLVLHDVKIQDYFFPHGTSCTGGSLKDFGYALWIAEKV